MHQARAVTQTLGLSSAEDSTVRPADLVAAFQSTCESQLQAVYAYIRYRVSSADSAEELTARTFLRALERLETFDAAKGELTPWILAIARNIVKDHLRAQRRWVWIPLGWLTQRESSDPGPELAMAAREERRQLGAALARLPDRDRDVLGLKFAANLANREIARITGLRESHVAVIVYRALGKLRRQLATANTTSSDSAGRPAESGMRSQP